MRTVIPENFDLNLIRYLVAIVETQSMVNAAEALDVAPSAVSYAVKKLRSYYNDPLFIRNLNGVTPTAFALNLYDRFKIIHNDIIQTLHIESMNVAPQHKIYIRADPLTELWIMDRLLGTEIVPYKCVIEFKKPSFDAEERGQKIRTQEIDLDIGISIAGDRNIISHTLFRTGYTLVCHHKHKTVDNSITLEEFKRLRYIAYGDALQSTIIRNDYHELLSLRDSEPAFRSSSPTTMLLCLLLQDFVMFIPKIYYPMLAKLLPLKEIKCDFLPPGKLAFLANINKKNSENPLLVDIVNVLKKDILAVPLRGKIPDKNAGFGSD